MTAPQPWEWPPEPKRRPRVEVLPPEPKPEVHIRITTQRDNRLQHWVVVAAVAFLVLILWRFKFGVLILLVMSPTIAEAAILLVLVLAFFARRLERQDCRCQSPADQSLAYTMQCLQIELFGSLRCHKLHGWPLDRFCDRFRIAEVVLLSL